MSKITMDMVRDLIERHSDHISGNTREFYNGAYAEIANELNATLDGKVNGDTSDGYHTFNEQDKPKFCMNCGAKVVSE